jgi:hypothetical protein
MRFSCGEAPLNAASGPEIERAVFLKHRICRVSTLRRRAEPLPRAQQGSDGRKRSAQGNGRHGQFIRWFQRFIWLGIAMNMVFAMPALFAPGLLTSVVGLPP